MALPPRRTSNLQGVNLHNLEYGVHPPILLSDTLCPISARFMALGSAKLKSGGWDPVKVIAQYNSIIRHSLHSR